MASVMRMKFSIAFRKIQFQVYGDTFCNNIFTSCCVCILTGCWLMHLLKIPVNKGIFETLKFYSSCSHEVTNNHKVSYQQPFKL